LEQFCDLYSDELKHLQNARPLLERLFHHIDTDKNQRLSFKEILFFKAITLPETDNNEKLRWIFLLYDTNQDRHIDQDEFIKLCYLVYHIHGHSLTNDRLDELKILFDKYDINNDRQLNCAEFIQLCHECDDLLKLMAPMFKWNSKVAKEVCPTFTNTSELTQNQIDYLIKRTRFSREQIKHYYEKFRNRCRSGHLSKDEFIDFYQQLLSSKSSAVYSEFIFQAFDNISKDGFIQFDEFLIAIYIHSNSSTPREKLEWLYNAYDRDGDGIIDYNEINQIVHALFILYGIDQEKYSVSYAAYEIMASLDINNDDKISKQEFLNMLKDKELTNFLAPSFIKQK
jgi:Ca2+-binding EF-hand superfamily protein